MGIKDVIDSQMDGAQESLHRLVSKRKFIGVTGLSRSGKSAFIASLVNQLINHDKAKLAAFSPWLSKHIKAVKLHPLEDRSLNQFPYQKAVSCLSNSTPHWPSSTVDLSGCLLEIKLKRSKPWPWESAGYSVFIEIRDYPGEWLLDLPLMEMSYLDWCSQCSAMFNLEPRAQLLGELLPALQELDPLEPYNDSKAKSLNARYVSFLKNCKENKNALSLIQPGRFLIPGEFAGQDVLNFVPIIGCSARTKAQLSAASSNSAFKVFEKRFDAYVKKVVIPFYKKFFKPINRQVVLVDVINALNGGPEYIGDMTQALSNISDSFSYGKNSPLASLFSPKIERVIFAASKVDQVVSKDHDNVRQMLATVVRKALKDAAYEGIDPKIEAIASIRSSQEKLHDGQLSVIGASLSGSPIGYIHPEIPDHIPTLDEWAPFIEWDIPALNPPAGVSCDQDQAIPHIRIDQVLQELIGDLCK